MSQNNFNLGKAAREWADKVTSEVKAAFGIGTSRDVMRDEVGKQLAKSVGAGLAKNSKEVVAQFSAMLKKLDYQRDFDIISENEYYRQLEALRDRYFSYGSENWVKYTEKIYSYQEKLLQQEKKAIEAEKKELSAFYDDVTSYALSRLDEVIKKQQKMSDMLSDSGSLYNVNTVHMNGFTDTYYSLHDLETDIAKIERYSALLTGIGERLEKSNISADVQEAFLSELKALGMNEAIGLSGALLNADDAKFLGYIGAWDKKEKLSEYISKSHFQEEFQSTAKDVYDEMAKALEEAGYEIPEGFFKSGSISAEKFGEAFILELDTQLAKIRDKIDEFNAGLSLEITPQGGIVYNTQNTSYSINTSGNDTVEQIRRYETLKRLAGVN